MNSFEIAAIAFFVGGGIGAFVEARYGSKVTSVVTTDVAKVETAAKAVETDVKKV